MSTRRESRAEGEGSTYYYRRTLSARELLPAVGAGVAVGVAAFYLAKLVLEKTPLRLSDESAPRRQPPRAAPGR